MRTTLTIDDFLVASVVRETGQKSPVAAIRAALEAYLKQVRKQKVLALRGTVDIADNWRELRELERQNDPWKQAESTAKASGA